MDDEQHSLKAQIPNQGWKQFLIARDEMLAAYDRAKTISKKRQVQTEHGNVAEAEFRKWLSNFLPKKYAVTSGYIISQGVPNSENFIHYDVIIYDYLEAPVLWIENNADYSSQGISLAIPVEYVRGVIEIKSAFNKKTARKAVEQLLRLQPLLAKIEPVDQLVKLYLPPSFFCATVFFELHKKTEMEFAALDEILEASNIRGYYGGYILRGETLDNYYSGKLSLRRRDSEVQADNKSLLFWASSKSKKIAENIYVNSYLDFSESYFAEFAFDIIALLKGNYHPNILSAYYGMGTTQWESGSAVDIRYHCPEDVRRFNEETEMWLKNILKK